MYMSYNIYWLLDHTINVCLFFLNGFLKARLNIYMNSMMVLGIICRLG